MVNFFVGLLGSAGIFAACYGVAFAFGFLRNYFARQPQEEVPAAPAPQPAPKRKKRRARPRSLTISLSGTAFPKGSVVITDTKGMKTSAKAAPERKAAVKTISAAEKKTYTKAVNPPSRPRPKASRGGKTTSARR